VQIAVWPVVLRKAGSEDQQNQTQNSNAPEEGSSLTESFYYTLYVIQIL
jgi:hypothetical protein